MLQRGQLVRVRHRNTIMQVEEPSVGLQQTLFEVAGYYAQKWRDHVVIALAKHWDPREKASVYLHTQAIPTELIEQVDWLWPAPEDKQPQGDMTTGPVSVHYQPGG